MNQFTFLAHWVENWNWLLWCLPQLHKNPKARWAWIWMWPIYTIAAVWYCFGNKSHDVVDNFRFNDIPGNTILIRNMGWQFMFKHFRNKIRMRILKAVLDAQDNTQVIGLGALTKAEWLTKGGQWIVDQLGDQLKVPIVHGDTLTAASVIKQACRIAKNFQIANTTVFITGATSKIGRAVVLRLAQQGVHIKMYTKSEERFCRIQDEAGSAGKNIVWARSLRDGKDCQMWLLGKSKPGSKSLLKAIPRNAVVLNFSVPNPMNGKAKARPDLRCFEAGLLAYDPKKTTLSFTMRLTPGITYACHAGTIVHAAEGWTHNEVSQVDLDQLDPTWEAAKRFGFFLPALETA